MKAIRTANQFLDDIVHWGDRAVRHVSDMTREQFLSEEKTQDAVSRCIEAIGEAANRAIKSDPGIATDFPAFEAEKAYAARNVLSHDYFKTDPRDPLGHCEAIGSSHSGRGEADSPLTGP